MQQVPVLQFFTDCIYSFSYMIFCYNNMYIQMMRYHSMKTDHFKLEITNRSVRITIFSNVEDTFAEDYRTMLTGTSTTKVVDLDFSDMPPSLINVFANATREPSPEKAPKSPTTKKRKSSTEASDEFKGKYHEYNYRKRLKKRTEKFRTLSYINFRVPNVQFVTLTFDPSTIDYATDLDACHHAFQKFIKRIRRRYSDFIYVATFSRQKNSNWHYHMLCNFDVNVKNKVIQDLWQNGMTHSTPLLSYGEMTSKISYCIDNMNKVAWTDLQGEKAYLFGRGLQSVIVFRSWKTDERDAAYHYLYEIINSTDKPLDISSALLEHTDDEDTAPRITYKISHKQFPELFQNVKTATPKKGTAK